MYGIHCHVAQLREVTPEEALLEYVDRGGIRWFDPVKLESAVSAPRWDAQMKATCDVFDIAASYAFHLSKSHAFIDGNKRTALFSMIAFLDINGAKRQYPENTAMMIEWVVEDKLTKGQLAVLLRAIDGAQEK